MTLIIEIDIKFLLIKKAVQQTEELHRPPHTNEPATVVAMCDYSTLMEANRSEWLQTEPALTKYTQLRASAFHMNRLSSGHRGYFHTNYNLALLVFLPIDISPTESLAHL